MKALLTFQVTPVPKARPRLGKYGVYTPQKTRDYEETLKLLARSQWQKPPMQGPLSLEAWFYLPRPKSVKRGYPSCRPDGDNLLKALMDSLNGILWVDDAQLIDIHASKRYGEPRVMVSLCAFPELED